MFTKSVSSVLESLNKIINDLDTVATQQTNQHLAKRLKAENLRDEAETHRNEAARAGSVASKLRALVA